MLCSLCNRTTRNFEIFREREYVQCTNCKAVLLTRDFYLSSQEEKSRYRLHNNDINDPGYKEFVSPVVKKIKAEIPAGSTGLDFGCGTGPVIASELQKSDYKIELYDPFFKPDRKKLKKQYDFIICCEVMEHFHDPLKEFKLLNSLLKRDARLYCKTSLWDEAIGFDGWHYKNDKTHVFFYTKETLEWIKENIGYSNLEIYDELIVFTR